MTSYRRTGKNEKVRRQFRTTLGGVVISGTATFRVIRWSGGVKQYLQADESAWSASSHAFAMQVVDSYFEGDYDIPASADGFLLTEEATHSAHGMVSVDYYATSADLGDIYDNNQSEHDETQEAIAAFRGADIAAHATTKAVADAILDLLNDENFGFAALKAIAVAIRDRIGDGASASGSDTVRGQIRRAIEDFLAADSIGLQEAHEKLDAILGQLSVILDEVNEGDVEQDGFVPDPP